MRDKISFLLGLEYREEGDFYPWQTLLSYLRSARGGSRCGTKEGCGEGDCGACSVIIAELDSRGSLCYRVVNSCITFLGSVDGKSVLTSEDLSRHQHPVHKLMIEGGGSQCGFCTPGFVVSLWGMYQSFKGRGVGSCLKSDRSWVEDNLAGNLCRCTGYGPINQVGTLMLAEDEGEEWRKFHEGLARRLLELSDKEGVRVSGKGKDKEYYLFKRESELIEHYQDSGGSVLVSGASDVGVWINKKFFRPSKLLDISQVEELKYIEESEEELLVGSGVRYSELMDLLRERIPSMFRLFSRIGSRQIRDVGTIAGNVMTASPIGDSIPVLMALGAEVILVKGGVERRVLLEDFFTGYRETVCEDLEYVRGFRIPLRYAKDLRCAKLSKRFDQDISTVSLALVLAEDVVRVVYGGMSDRVRRAFLCENVLKENSLSEEVIGRACASLEKEFSPMSDVRGSSWYRMESAKGLLRRLCYDEMGRDVRDLSYFDDFREWISLGEGGSERDVEIGEESGEESVLGVSLAHDSAELHVLGRALYTDDIAERSDSLVTYVHKSEVSRGRLFSLDVSEVAKQEGVLLVLTAEDVEGLNDTSPMEVGDDPIFIPVGGEIRFHGAVLLAVIAKTMDEAREAAKEAVYEIERFASVLDVEGSDEEISEGKIFERGDLSLGKSNSEYELFGSLRIGGQDHFYLEGQVSLAEPYDDGVRVYSSTQNPTEIQQVVSRVLGEPFGYVNVEVRRMGGGFGGKETQAAQWSAIAALAATRLNRSVRVCLDRDDDMKLTGKRHEFFVKYEVGFRGDGRIQSADFDLLGDCGCSIDLSPAVNDRAMLHTDNAYSLGDVRISSKRLFTNKVSATAFRGFGGPQGMMGSEWVMEEISRRLGMDALDVRYRNFYGGANDEVTPYGMEIEDNVLHDLVGQLERSSGYRERREEIRLFNRQAMSRGGNVRRGLALTPVKFGIAFTTSFLNQAGALLNIYKDGSVVINHGGTEMGQGLLVKVKQLVSDGLRVSESRVLISGSSTGKVPNTSATAASSGTDLNGAAALQAVDILNRRMKEHIASEYGVDVAEVEVEKERYIIGNEVLTFEEVVKRCYLGRVSLSSTGFYRTPKIGSDRLFYYFVYGGAVSEVALDILSGESRLLNVDILHDVGSSINPLIDMGQIEGGFVQGVGWLTSEELVWDDSGKLLSHAPSTYKIPGSGCSAKSMRIGFYDNKNREETPYRSKAVGEPPLMLGISVFHAIADAIYQTSEVTISGRRAARLRAPATPESILFAIRDLERNGTL